MPANMLGHSKCGRTKKQEASDEREEEEVHALDKNTKDRRVW